MLRHQFEHLVAAAANVVEADEFVVIGSQAILGPCPEAPGSLLRSLEVDIYPSDDPTKADLIDGALGDGSQFHRSFGYYAHGVGPETAKAPAGWRERLIRVDVPPRLNSSRRPVAWCLEPHDLVLAKCVAGRERDWQFARDALAAGLVNTDTLAARVSDLPVRIELNGPSAGCSPLSTSASDQPTHRAGMTRDTPSPRASAHAVAAPADVVDGEEPEVADPASSPSGCCHGAGQLGRDRLSHAAACSAQSR